MQAPHRAIKTRSEKERFLVGLLDALWAGYRARMPAVQRYERLIAEDPGVFLNDHLAFRCFAAQKPLLGIPTISRVFEALDRESQFGAWVLLNGYGVNHFTAAVSDIDRTVALMKGAGIAMKDEIEGAPGGKLRQSATLAAVATMKARQGRKTIRFPWTYAYFELAQRRDGFQGFLGPQASGLFEMTKLRR